MSDIQFQGPLEGTLSANIVDNDGKPAQVLEASKDIKVEVKWSLNDLASQIMCGVWQVDLYAESIGKGFEDQLGYVDVTIQPDQKNYQTDLIVKANTLPNNPPPPPGGRVSGAYKLALVLSHRNSGGKTTFVAGIVEFPVLLIR